MRKLLVVAAVATVTAAPSIASAATRCERDNSTNRVGGTVIGAGVGALLGSAIAGNSSNTEGTIIGGIAGAIAGNQIAKNTSQPCPPGYVLYDERGPVYPQQAVAPPPRNEFWDGAPAAPRERISFMENRIRRGVNDGTLTRREADQAYRDLAEVRRMENQLRRRSGGRLTGADREYIQARLDDVGERIRWMRRNQARY